MMKLYISGKITGLVYADAQAAFANAKQRLESLGYKAINPMEDEKPNLTWEEYMCNDIKVLFECDGIYLMSNWQDSKGARIEKAICEITEKPVFYEGTESLI